MKRKQDIAYSRALVPKKSKILKIIIGTVIIFLSLVVILVFLLGKSN